MFFVLILMMVVSAIINPIFLTSTNLFNILGQNAIVGVMALGMVFALITGSFDMSVSSTAALTAVVATYFFKSSGFVTGVIGGLCVGLVIGLINGLLVTKARINPFVTTLGMQTFGRGMVYIITGAKPITGIPAAYGVVGMGRVGPVPVPALIWAGFAVVMWAVLSKTVFGQYVYATGGNKRSAWLSGVNTDKVKISALILSGVFASIGGIIYNLRVLMCTADALSTYELTVMASCIIGGTSLEGGRGSVPGAIIGTLIMGILINILQIAGVSSFWQAAVTGVIIIGAVGIDSLTSRVRE
jgi:ribose/xylose/arabinose/galactoside ABC-type transport system permease subunit